MRKLLNFRPALFTAFYIVISLYSTFLFVKGKAFLGILISALTIVASVVFCFLYGKKKIVRNLIFLVITVALSLITALGFSAQVRNYENSTLENGYYDVNGKVKDITYTQNYTVLILDDVSVRGVRVGEIDYKVRVFVGGSTFVDVGDIVKFNAKIKDRGLKFDGRYYWNDVSSGVKYTCSISRDDLAITDRDRNFLETFNVFIRETLKSGMDEDSFAVAYALICGNSDYTDTDVFDGYRKAGVAHIFAVSGLHVGFLSAILFFLFKGIKLNDYIKTGVILLVLFLYSGVCGFSSSSLRATVMFGVLSFARSSGKRYDMLSSVSIAFILLAVIDPIQVFTAGFILSFGVVYGIAILGGPIERELKFLPNKFSSSLSVVISAQIFFIPLSIAIFEEFSTIALIVNLIFVPIVGVIYAVTFVGMLIGGAFGIASVTLYPSNLIFKAINFLINSFDYEIFIIGGFTLGSLIVFYYLNTLIIGGIINFEKLVKRIAIITLSVIFVGGTVAINVCEFNSSKIYVLGETDMCLTLIDGKENVMVVSYAKDECSVERLNALALKTDIAEIDKLVFLDSYEKADVHALLTAFNQILEIKTVYYPEKDVLYDEVLKKSFAHIEVVSFSTKMETIELFKDVNCYCFGKALEINSKSERALIFSDFGDYVDKFSGFSLFDMDVVVAYDCVSEIEKEYSPKQTISYLPYKNYENGNTNGYYTLEIK